MDSVAAGFQFAQPLWLWGLMALPLIWGLYALFYKRVDAGSRLAEFADPHLLPHLLGNGETGVRRKKRTWLSVLIWSLLWALGLIAMAGPRWDYTDVKAFSPARNLVILLDLSKSMDAEDVRPSRLGRARQEIEDIGRLAEGMNIGLVAFASVPHVITPLTDDRETINRLLPSLNTGLVHVQGSNLVSTLERAAKMLGSEQGSEKHILIISDGGFDDSDAAILRAEQGLKKQDIRIHVMGMGSTEGAPVPDGNGAFIKENGNTVIARLNEARLQRIAQDGGGIYMKASYLENDTQRLLSRINAATESEEVKTTRIWEERFYLFLLPFAFFILPWFRRNAAFPVLLLCMIQAPSAHAFEWRDMFMNKQQQAQQAVETQQYDKALEMLDDPYRRGVAQYKAGDYEAAQRSFAASDRPEVGTDAQYNLGNAQLMSGKIEESIKTYEDLLKETPDHADAKHNLEIAKKLLEQQQQQQEQDKEKQQDHKEEDEEQDKEDGEQGQDDQDSDEQNEKNDGSQEKESDQGEQKDQQDKGQQDENEKKEDGEQENKGKPEDQDQEKDKDEQQKERDQAAQDEEEKRRQEEERRRQQQQQQDQERQDPQQEEREAPPPQQGQRTQQDIDADNWLNRIEGDTDSFLKNKFFIESQRQGAKEGKNPW